MTEPTKQDLHEFQLYLQDLTPAQVVEVWRKENKAGRNAYAALAIAEARRRGWPL